jgi:predicted metal-dependent HD superfamily phosphohydrolase
VGRPDGRTLHAMKQVVDRIWLRSSWSRCWSGLGALDGQQRMNDLIAAYDESHRKYHTVQHLGECLTLFDRYRHLAIEPHEVELALWFHDAIYSVRAGGNEEKSAKWAATSMREVGIAEVSIERVHGHILATRHAALPDGQDQTLLVDIDLSILGAIPVRFDEYEAQVRAEYRWVPDLMFKPKRREILQEFLARPSIYGTPAIASELEARARENLARSLRALSD